MFIRIDGYIGILKSYMRNGGIETSAYTDELEQRDTLVGKLKTGA